MAWVHSKELADLQEFLGLPRKLPEPKYPENIWAAFKRNEEKQSKRKSTNAVTVSFDSTDKKNMLGDYEVFSGTVSEVHDWCQANKGKYDYMGHTNRTVMSEEEVFEIWKAKILAEYGLNK